MEGNEITVLLRKDLFDYILSIMPLVLSCIAIGISIYFAKRQNKDSLFEKRYKAYCFLRFVGSVAENLHVEEHESLLSGQCSHEQEKELVEDYSTEVVAVLSCWANMRMFFDGTVSDSQRIKVVDACINANMNFEVYERLNVYLENDREILDQAALLYDKNISETINSTSSTYYALFDQALMMITEKKAHAIDGFEKKLSAFLDVASNWEKDSRTMKKLKQLIHY